MLLGIEVLAVTYVSLRLLRPNRRRSRLASLRCAARSSKNDGVKAANVESNFRPGKTIKRSISTVARYETPGMLVPTTAVAVTSASLLIPALAPVGIVTVSLALVPVLRKTENNLRSRRPRIDNDLLNSIVGVTCIGLGHYAIGSLFAWFSIWADRLTTRVTRETKKVLTDAMKQPPKVVWTIRDGAEVEVAIDDVVPGDVIVVAPGDVIAVDGTIINGMATIDEHGLTGEAVPAEKTMGDVVFASTLVVGGRIQVRIERVGMETAIAKITYILLHTADFKLDLQTKGEKWADKLSTPLLAVGGVLAPLIGAMPALTVLYSGPGNMLKTLISLQLLAHMILFTRHGILVKDGRALETLQRVDTVLFDKTGTLTRDTPQVGEILTFAQHGAETVLRLACIAEQRHTHPIARAIRQKAEKHGLLNGDAELETADYHVGYGISARIDGYRVEVGSLRFMGLSGISLPDGIDVIRGEFAACGSSLVAVAIDGALAGALEIAAVPRPEVLETIASLRRLGVRNMAIVSGDHEQPTRRLAEDLGIDEYYFNVLPQGKAGIVEDYQAHGATVCFVGDGVNDAVAIKQADVSISLNGATALASDLAQIILLRDDLSGIVDLLKLSTRLKRRSFESLMICSTYGISTFGAGALLQVGLIFPMTIGTAIYFAGLAHAFIPLWAQSTPSERLNHVR